MTGTSYKRTGSRSDFRGIKEVDFQNSKQDPKTHQHPQMCIGVRSKFYMEFKKVAVPSD